MITRCRPLLGTMVEITVEDRDSPAIDAAFAAIAYIHARMSFHEPASDLARLRAASAGEIVEVDCETVAVLRVAVALYHATDGLFDVAIGRELVRNRFLPNAGIDNLREFDGDAGDIEVVDDRHVSCRRRVLVDLGGIAKGYAVDRAVATLVGTGVTTGIVNAGGDLRLFGEQSWPVHIRAATGNLDHLVNLANVAIASSSNMHNRKRRGGKTHSPHLGRGRQSILADQTVSVVANQCTIADAMTKVAMVDPALAGTLLAPYRGYVLQRPIVEEAA